MFLKCFYKKTQNYNINGYIIECYIPPPSLFSTSSQLVLMPSVWNFNVNSNESSWKASQYKVSPARETGFSKRCTRGTKRSINEPLKNKQEVRPRALPSSQARTSAVTVMGQAEGFTRSALICADLPGP